jgi:hypothetical protein
MRGIAWWRVMKGSAIEFKNQNEKDKIADES